MENYNVSMKPTAPFYAANVSPAMYPQLPPGLIIPSPASGRSVTQHPTTFWTIKYILLVFLVFTLAGLVLNLFGIAPDDLLWSTQMIRTPADSWLAFIAMFFVFWGILGVAKENFHPILAFGVFLAIYTLAGIRKLEDLDVLQLLFHSLATTLTFVFAAMNKPQVEGQSVVYRV